MKFVDFKENLKICEESVLILNKFVDFERTCYLILNKFVKLQVFKCLNKFVEFEQNVYGCLKEVFVHLR